MLLETFCMIPIFNKILTDDVVVCSLQYYVTIQLCIYYTTHDYQKETDLLKKHSSRKGNLSSALDDFADNC